MTSSFSEVKSRGDKFSTKLETKITFEQAPEHNPYHVQQQLIHGYDHLDLVENCQFLDVLFLLLRGNLPSKQESKLFNKLAIAIINPGLRHPSAQASIIAGVGKSDTVNILPITLGVFGGQLDGAGNIEETLRYLRKAARKPAADFVEQALNHEIPSVTQLYGDADTYANILLDTLKTYAGTGKIFAWIYQLQFYIYPKNVGITKTTITAAILADLGFQPRAAASIMQLFSAPGLLAHGLEYSNKPLTSMLFETDDNYIIEESSDVK